MSRQNYYFTIIILLIINFCQISAQKRSINATKVEDVSDEQFTEGELRRDNRIKSNITGQIIEISTTTTTQESVIDSQESVFNSTSDTEYYDLNNNNETATTEKSAHKSLVTVGDKNSVQTATAALPHNESVSNVYFLKYYYFVIKNS
jgi:hypothetical protein